jgi:mono/diheme cytochrome c family protein
MWRLGAPCAIALVVTVVIGGLLSAAAGRGQSEQPAPDHQHGDAAEGHLHAPIPPEYKSAHLPASAWTNPRLIARGKQIHTERCAVCHGDSGDGKGPAGMALPLKPPDLRDAKMVGEMTGNYWFWRVSEGGAVEPFKSAGSVMPAWKHELSVQDRWAVIVYQHTFSGHDGPHVTSEHPESVMGSHAGQGTSAKAGGTSPASSTPAGAPGGGHRH